MKTLPIQRMYHLLRRAKQGSYSAAVEAKQLLHIYKVKNGRLRQTVDNALKGKYGRSRMVYTHS